MDTRFTEGESNILYRNELLKQYLGKKVHIGIDRPIGYIHKKEKYSLQYKINYGYIPNVLGGDGEELDVYLLGVNIPVVEYDCVIIGAVRRRNDIEDKLIGAPAGFNCTKEDMMEAVEFQEKYYDSYIITHIHEIE